MISVLVLNWYIVLKLAVCVVFKVIQSHFYPNYFLFTNMYIYTVNTYSTKENWQQKVVCNFENTKVIMCCFVSRSAGATVFEYNWRTSFTNVSLHAACNMNMKFCQF